MVWYRELFRQATFYLAELFRQIASPYKICRDGLNLHPPPCETEPPLLCSYKLTVTETNKKKKKEKKEKRRI